MKSKFFLICILFFSSFIHSQVPSDLPTNGLVGWWPFNGNANDESGNGNDGTVNGAILTSDRFNNLNKAYSFDASQQNFISVENHESLILTNEMTISAWFKIGENNCVSAILGMGMSGEVSGSGYNLLATSDCFNQYTSFGRRNPYLSENHAVLTNQMYSNDVWTHIVATYDGVDMKIYVNGIFNNSVEHIFDLEILDDPLFFGRELLYLPNERYLTGKLDDIGIWNRTLTDSEIEKIFYIREQSPTDVQHQTNESNIDIYPNPTTDIVNIKVPDYVGGKVKIMSMSGQIVYEENITQSKMTLSVVDRLSKGIYIVTTTDSGGNILSNEKLIVQ